MGKIPARASDSASSGASQSRGDGAPDLPGDWLSEAPLQEVADPAEPEALAGFLSEGDPPLPAARPMRFPAARRSRAAVLVVGALVVSAIVAIVVLDVLVPLSSRSKAQAPVSAPAPPAGVVALPTQEAASSVASSPAKETPRPPPQRDVALAIAPRPTAALVTSSSSATIWDAALSRVRAASSESTTPLDTLVGRTSVPPPASPPTPVLELAAAPTSSEPASTPEMAARAARTASVRSVLDRYRDAFNSLDANAVDAFWPGVDRRALRRTFAALESQHLQFGRCDIQLAGARAFASCSGYAEYTRKNGSREARFEPRRWMFTFGEVKDGWVILGVDVRQER